MRREKETNLAGLEVEKGEVLALELEEVDHGEDGLGEEVENTIENHLGGGRNDVSSVTQSPGDRVEGPENEEAEGRESCACQLRKLRKGRRLELQKIESSTYSEAEVVNPLPIPGESRLAEARPGPMRTQKT
jgi:hypothetical protein